MIMASLPWFPFFAKDWLVSTMEMSNEEKGAYIDLLCMQWENGYVSRIPTRYAREWATLKPKFQIIEDGKFVNPRLQEIRAEKEDILNKQRLGGIKGAKSRYGLPNDLAISSQSQSQNQKKESEKEKEEETPEPAVPTPLTNRLKKFAEDALKDPEKVEALKAAYPGVDLIAELAKWLVHWLNDLKGAPRSRFGRSFNNWLKRAENPPTWLKDRDPSQADLEHVKALARIPDG